MYILLTSLIFYRMKCVGLQSYNFEIFSKLIEVLYKIGNIWKD